MMWIFSADGFFSVVRANPRHAQLVSLSGLPADHEDVLCVRSRVRADLERFCDRLQINHSLIFDRRQAGSTDYPYRVFVHRDDFSFWLGSQSFLVDYFNFKDFTRQSLGAAREFIYHKVWAACLGLSDSMDAADQKGR